MAWLLVGLVGLLPLAAARPALISTDPGIDDSIALLLALASPELDVQGVCINFGSLHNTSQLAENALSVLALAKRSDIPVYLGASEPLARPFVDLGGPLFHGEDGLGGAPRPAPRASVNHSFSAAEAIVHACRSGQQPLLLSFAPLTNVALALALEPQLPRLCPDLYLMGGAVAVPGNVGPLAEANIANDPEAAERVLSAGFTTHVAGLDVTMSTWLSPSFLASLRELNAAGDFIWRITRFYERAYESIGGFEGGMPLHDPSAVMMFLFPEHYVQQRWAHGLQTSGPFSGTLLVDRRGGPRSPAPPKNVTVHFGMEVQSQAVQQALYSRIAALASESEELRS